MLHPLLAAVPMLADDGASSPATLLVIGGALLVGFVAVVWWISRDARGSLTAEDRERLEHPATPEERRAATRAAHQAKTRTRRKRAAQRAARKRNR
jgi:hypothetical protein